MTSKEKLQNICNYFEQKYNPSPIFQLPIIEMVSEDNEYLLAEKKRQNRELAIDITLGEKDESEWSKKDMIEPPTWGQTISDKLESASVISPKVITLNLSISNLKTHDEVYDYVIDFIDRNTNVAKKLQNGGNSMQFNVQIGGGNYPVGYTESEKFEADLRKIITKANLCSNVIAMEGRIGPSKTIIVGKANWIYFREIESRYGSINMKVIYDDKINPNKVVVLRNGTKSDPGIILIENNGTDFYIKETTKWDRQFCWFWIN
jgi:hypothetical protein